MHKSINHINHINGLRDKNHSIFSIDADKVFVKIQHTFMITVPERVRQEEAYLKLYMRNSLPTSS